MSFNPMGFHGLLQLYIYYADGIENVKIKKGINKEQGGIISLLLFFKIRKVG
jgi:hypothetical protein